MQYSSYAETIDPQGELKYADFLDTSFLNTGLNLDLMLNLYSNGKNSFGFFGRVGLDYSHRLSTELVDIDGYLIADLMDALPSLHSLQPSGRVGLSALFASHHCIDLLAKLPVGILTSSTALRTYLMAFVPTIGLSVGYKYIF